MVTALYHNLFLLYLGGQAKEITVLMNAIKARHVVGSMVLGQTNQCSCILQA